MKLLLAALTMLIPMFGQGRSTPIDNEYVKVLKVTQAPHQKTGLHKHDMNRVMIYLDAGKQTIAYEGGKTVTLNWKPGQPLWSPASGMHIAEIVSDNTVTIVELELKKPTGGRSANASALDPVKADSKHYKVEFENDQVRVIRVKIGPKQSVPMHEHSLDRIVVYITDQDFKVTGADGKEVMAKHKAGDVGFSTPSTHKEENLSDKPFEIVVVELKG